MTFGPYCKTQGCSNQSWTQGYCRRHYKERTKLEALDNNPTRSAILLYLLQQDATAKQISSATGIEIKLVRSTLSRLNEAGSILLTDPINGIQVWRHKQNEPKGLWTAAEVLRRKWCA